MRLLAVLALLLALGAAASSAGAATQPLVPPFIQGLVKARAGTLAYVPTRAPIGYRYSSYTWNGGTRVLTIRLAHRREPRRTISFTARRSAVPLARCGEGRLKTLQLDGNKVYWDGTTAWRCVRGRDGRPVRLSATGVGLTDVPLGIVVASGKRL